MIKHLQHMSQKISEKAEQLARSITERQNDRYPIQRKIEHELLPVREKLVELYAKALVMNEEERLATLKEWGEVVGARLAKHDIITLDMTLRELPYYRESIGEVIKNETLVLGLGVEEMYELIGVLDCTLNKAVYFFSVPFVQHEKEKFQVSQAIATELIVPIVSINDQIAILPIVGTFNYDRAGTLQKRVLKNASELQLEILIIDLSGLQTTETYIVQQLLDIFDALTLLGIQPIVSGISPEIAQTLVNLGLTFGRIKSFGTLKQALAYIG